VLLAAWVAVAGCARALRVAPAADPAPPGPARQAPPLSAAASPSPVPEPAAAPEPAPTPTPTPAGEAPPAPRIREQTRATARERAKEVSFNFENVDLEIVLRAFADLTGFNFVVAPGVRAQITLYTTGKVPTTEAFAILEAVLEAHNLAAVKAGNLYKIVPLAVAQQQSPELIEGGNPEEEDGPKPDASERLVIQIVRLQAGTAEDLVRVLQPFLTRGAKLVAHRETNTLILSGFHSTVRRLLEVVRALDKPAVREPQPRIYVYYVENAEAKRLAEVLNTLFGRRAPAVPRPAAAPTPAPPPSPFLPVPPAVPGVPRPPAAEVVGEITIVADEVINALVIRTAPENYPLIEETIRKLDIVPKQVVIQVMIAEVTLTNETDFGLEYLLRKGNIASQGGFGVPTGSVPTVNLIPGGPGALSVSGFLFSFLNQGQFSSLLRLLETLTDVKILANPHILTSDNKEARIQVGQEVPIVTNEQATLTSLTQPGQPGQNVFRNIQQRDVGVILKVKPHINEKRLVTLDIEQEISDVLSQRTGDIGSPTFSKRTAKTSAVVQDRQTLVIAGIIQDRKRQERSGVPYLSKIPVLGPLFGRTQESTTRTEVLIFLTPHVITSPEEGTALTQEFEERARAVREQLERARQAR
jgi:general secretion pathway protein D